MTKRILRLCSGCDNLKGLVHQTNDGNEVPSLSKKFIHKCLGDLGLLRTPRRGGFNGGMD